MSKSRPEPGVSYAGGRPEFREASRCEAVRGLARFLAVTETRAADLLESGQAAAEIRSRQAEQSDCPWCRYEGGLPLTADQARQVMDGRYPPEPWSP